MRILLRSLNPSTLLFWASVPGAILRELASEVADRLPSIPFRREAGVAP